MSAEIRDLIRRMSLAGERRKLGIEFSQATREIPAVAAQSPLPNLAIAPNHRGLSLGHRAPLSAAGPGRIMVRPFAIEFGGWAQRGCYRAAVTLAESLRRAWGVLSQYFQYITRRNASLAMMVHGQLLRSAIRPTQTPLAIPAAFGPSESRK
jgi:hypothetical protein